MVEVLAIISLVLALVVVLVVAYHLIGIFMALRKAANLSAGACGRIAENSG